MQSIQNITIFSRPVQSGKTTALQKFITQHYSVAGFLTPDINGRRMLYDIANAIYFPFETDENSELPIVKVGRFSFLQEGFARGQAIMNDAKNKKWIIIDEVGKLEIEQNKGFESGISQLIDYCKKNTQTNLVIVIRDSLVKKAVEKYNLQHATITDIL